MKKNSTVLVIIFSLFILSAKSVLAQGSTTQSDKELQKAQIQALVDAQHFSFIAQKAVPLEMPSRQLVTDYELKIDKDTIQAFLPYFGKTNSFNVGSTDNGINFKSGNFKYTKQDKKKGGWNIKVVLKDAGDTKEVALNITSSGFATLEVSSENKQSISFNGYIQ